MNHSFFRKKPEEVARAKRKSIPTHYPRKPFKGYKKVHGRPPRNDWVKLQDKFRQKQYKYISDMKKKRKSSATFGE